MLAAHGIKFETTNITYKLHYEKAEFSSTITAIQRGSRAVTEAHFSAAPG